MNNSLPEQLFRFDNHIVVITGGLGQLGLQYAKAFLHRGARVVLFDLAQKPMFQNSFFKSELDQGTLSYFQCDVSVREQVESVADQVVGTIGAPTVLINNAAIDAPPDAPIQEVGPFETYPESSLDKVLAVNVKGTVFCCQVIGGIMAREGLGSIINVSSTYGILSPCQDIYEFRRQAGEVFYKPVAYSISKSAVLNLTRYLATYWARKGVRVNTVTPGGIYNNQPEEFLEEYCKRVPMGRMANEDEIVGAMLYLASPLSSYVTGANIVVDGGWSAW